LPLVIILRYHFLLYFSSIPNYNIFIHSKASREFINLKTHFLFF
jgi:hypothetical protein